MNNPRPEPHKIHNINTKPLQEQIDDLYNRIEIMAKQIEDLAPKPRGHKWQDLHDKIQLLEVDGTIVYPIEDGQERKSAQTSVHRAGIIYGYELKTMLAGINLIVSRIK